MSKQPFYHDAQFEPALTEEEQRSLVRIIKFVPTVVKRTVQAFPDQIPWTATSDVSEDVRLAILERLGRAVSIEVEAGDPTDRL